VPDLITRIAAALEGRYTILRELGHGGMAVVFLADDLRHGRQVAVKVIRPEVLRALGPDRFEREIGFAARLSHPHILPLFDSGVADGLAFFVMPYVTGESLRERLARERPLPLEEAVKIARDVASALSYAHAQGIIHRDIKPENILLEGGEARVADFGIARATAGAPGDIITTSGLVVGTPAYMSPEQAAGSPDIDTRSDLYALGTVLYEMLTGEPPFSGVSAQAIMARQTHDTPTPVAVLRPAVPLALADLTHRLLRKLPVDRPANAGEVLHALQQAGTPTPLPSTAVRRRTWRGVFALGGLVAGAAVVWAVNHSARAVGDPNRVGVVVGASSPGAADSTRAAQITGALVAALNSSGVITAIELHVPPGKDGTQAAKAAGLLRWVEGTVLVQDSLRLTLAIRTPDGLKAVVPTVTEPLPAADWTVGFEAANQLVERLLPMNSSAVSLPLGQGRSPAARADFFLGEASYRRASFEEAMKHYRAAFAEDSTFTYAALRAAQAASWLNRAPEAAALLEATGPRLDSLPPKYAAFAHGVLAYQQGHADTAVARFKAVLGIDPASVEGWMALGEVYAHLLPRAGSIDSLAEHAFTQARRLDPAFAPALPHLVEAALRRGDTSTARLLDEFAAGNPDDRELERLRLATGCALGGVQSVNWPATAARDPALVYDAVQILTGGGLRQAGCAQAAADAIGTVNPSDALRFGALVARQGILVARGDASGARSAVESDSMFPLVAQGLILTLDVIAGAPDTAAATAFATSTVTRLAERPEDVGDGTIWLAGVWSAGIGHLREAERLHATAVERRGRAAPLTRSLWARLLLARFDTVAAMTILAANAPEASRDLITGKPWESLVADRILLAQLYLARHQPFEAIEAASVVDAPAVVADIVFLPMSLRIRADAADLVGDQQLARESRRRLAALSETPPDRRR
jgi:serine/threonine-protein kinase